MYIPALIFKAFLSSLLSSQGTGPGKGLRGLIDSTSAARGNEAGSLGILIALITATKTLTLSRERCMISIGFCT